MLGLVRKTTTTWRLLAVCMLVLAAVATAASWPGRRARAVSVSGHAPISTNWGERLRATPNATPAGLPPMIAGLQPVPLAGGRTILLHLPPRSYLAHPLIFVLHGVANTPASIEKESGFDALADRQGYILAYGVGVARSWDAGSCCGAAVTQHVDDVSYLAEAVSAISSHYSIDLSRIVVTGFSNGGMLAFRAACERPDLFRAALTVSGPLVARCPNPITVIHVHGTLDSMVPVTGGYSSFTHTTFPDSRTEASRLPRGSHEKLVLWPGGHHWATPSYGVDINALLLQLVG